MSDIRDAKDVMLDLETLDNIPSSVVISVGACQFNIDTGEIVDTFHMRVDPQSCLDRGCTVSGDTIRWWMSQSDEARKQWQGRAEDLYKVITRFTSWIKMLGISQQDLKVWGNGATFDNAIISNLYRITGIQRPWGFRNDRDCRTIAGIAQAAGLPDYSTLPRDGIYHNALDDAKYQAKWVSDYWSKLKGGINGKEKG